MLPLARRSPACLRHRALRLAQALSLAAAAAACSADRPAPLEPSATHPELRGMAVVVTVDVRNGTLTIGDAATATTARGATPGGRAGEPRFALVGDNELGATLSNYYRSAVGAYVAKKVRVRFDVALTNRLGGASLVTPTFPQPPLGQAGLLLIPFNVTGIVGGGAVAPSTDWDGDGTVGSGAPYNFFNDFGSCAKSAGNDCYRWEAFASPLAAGATSAAHTVGFDVDPTVQSFQVYMVLAADLKDDFPPQTGAVSGTVTSPQRGALVGVTVTETGGATATTGVGGAYQLTGLAVGGTTVTLSNLPAGCVAPAAQGATVTAGGITNVSFSVACAQARIVFASTRTGDEEIFTMNPDGTATTQLTNSAGDDYEPVWSPDGTKIAFTSKRDGGDAEIYVMNANGTGVTRLTNSAGFDGNPSWSPDGTKIAFASTRDEAPYGEVYVMNADGTNVTRLTTSAGDDFAPRWSPDGTRIAFVSHRDGDYEIYVMNANGGAPTRLTASPGLDTYPAWSPDGTKIAFASDRNASSFVSDIYVMNADGSGVTRLTTDAADDAQPRWSPDGTKIVFASNRDGNYEVYVMNADGTGQTNLTSRLGDDWFPAW